MLYTDYGHDCAILSNMIFETRGFDELHKKAEEALASVLKADPATYVSVFRTKDVDIKQSEISGTAS